jgi:glucose-6-phosphate isomerase
MNLKFYNCPKPADLDTALLPKEVNFLSYEPDLKFLNDFKNAYTDYKNLLIVGHGGSITSSDAFYNSLKYSLELKRVEFLNTTDPDYIHFLKQKFNPKETLVLAISKAGETITQWEILSQLLDFSIVVITQKSSSLRAFAEKLGWKIINHPNIGGRFTGLTEVGLLPAMLCGIEIKNILAGAKPVYLNFYKANLAWDLASVLYQLEVQGMVDVFMPFYSQALYAFNKIIVQLCHESFGKAGKGQTFFAHESPESQHHTNQRFFGGIKNICGLFISQQRFKHNLLSVYPAQTHSVQIKGHSLFDINKIPLAESMHSELLGTLQNAQVAGIPSMHLEVSEISETTLGEFLAFWQIFAVYSAVLRQVDPFDQPQVENSKNISFTNRLQFKGLL